MKTPTPVLHGRIARGLPPLLLLAACRPDAPVPAGFLDDDATTSGAGSTSSGLVGASSGDDVGTGDATGTTGPVIPDGTSTSEATEGSVGTTEGSVGTTETTEGSMGTTEGGPVCGDGMIEGDEDCDDAGESATCDVDCTPVECGDGGANTAAGEQCDGADLEGATCATQGFDGGALACDGACMLDTSGCTTCGDGIVSPPESCEGDDLGGTTCVALGFDGGALACAADCSFAVDGCYLCGDGIVAPEEQCDDGGESATCDADCTPVVCGDGVPNGTADEACDTAGPSALCDADCTPVECGDGLTNGPAGEQCDDGNLVDDDACSNACMLNTCGFDVSLLPLVVHPGNFYGELDFDGSCNLVVSGSFQGSVYRVTPAGVVSVLAAGFGASSINGIAYRASDDVVYVATDGPAQLWAVSPAGAASLVMPLPTTINAIEVAPAGFGPYGDLVVGVGTTGIVYGFDPAAASTMVMGSTAGILSSLAFDPAGALLYVAAYDQGAVLQMDALGVFGTVTAGLVGPDGLAISPAGELFVADSSTATVSSIDPFTGTQSAIGSPVLDGGFYVTGLLYEGGGHLLTKVQGASIDYLTPP
jgi:cysteine-rich repeat protein